MSDNPANLAVDAMSWIQEHQDLFRVGYYGGRAELVRVDGQAV